MTTRRAFTAGLTASILVPGWTAGALPPLAPAKEVWTAKVAPASQAWLFNELAMPLLRVRASEEISLDIRNGTSVPLAFRFHGMRGFDPFAPRIGFKDELVKGKPVRRQVPAPDGGLLQEPIQPNGSHAVRFTPAEPGTYLLRAALPGKSAEANARGLQAMVIVEETEPPAVSGDYPLLVTDWKLDDSGAPAPFTPAGGPVGRLGNKLAVNGVAAPHRIEAAPGSRIRLRLANGCNARIMRVRFDRMKATVIAVDGQPADLFEPLNASLPFAPGNRYDLMVDMPDAEGAAGQVTAVVGDGIALVELVAKGGRAPASPPLQALRPNPSLPSEIKLQNATRATAVFEYSETSGWRINGKTGSADNAALVKVRRGAPVVLTLTNKTPYPLPFHLHGHNFRLLHAFDDGWEPYFLDTLQIPENKTVRIAFVADNPGQWMFASTVLERFDAGLWTWFEVS